MTDMPKPEIPEKFKNAIDILDNGMVLKLITKVGDDSPRRAAIGTTAKIHYTGTLLDGSKFDSSRDRNDPFSTEVGVGKVIRGWDTVMPTMAKNERCEVLIQSDYAYGSQGSPPSIPANSPLIFDMEMLNWSGQDISEDKNGSLTKIFLSQKNVDDDELNSAENPTDNAEVVIDIQKSGCEKVENFKYVIGEELLYPESFFGICGIRTCLKSMRLNEESEFELQKLSEYNNTKTDLTFTIKLHSCENPKEVWNMNCPEIMEMCKKVKERGTELYKNGNLDVALNKYSLIAKYMDSYPYTKDTTEEKKDEEVEEKEDPNWEVLKIASLSNLALVNLKLKNNRDCINVCQNILELDNKNEKALFRTAEAFSNMKDLENSADYYKQVLELNTENRQAKIGLARSKKMQAAYKQAEKKKYSKMFA